jgi:hypothetical protein
MRGTQLLFQKKMPAKAVVRKISTAKRAKSKNKSPVLLVMIAAFVALLAGTLAGLFGGIIALLVVFFFVFVGVSMSDYRAGVLLAVVLLPLTATAQLPRELFGIKGLNPLNAVLVMSVMSLVIMQAFAHTKLILPVMSRQFWFYLGAIFFAGVFGAFHVSSIPSYYQVLQVISFDSPAGYVRDVLLKPMIILATAYMLSIAVANAVRPSRFLPVFFFSAVNLPLVVIAYVAVSGVSLSVLASAHSRGFLSVLGIHANELGFMFNMAFALSVFCFFAVTRPLVKLVLLGLCGILILAIGLTFSRGAYLGLIVVLAYFLFTQRKFRMMMLVVVMVIAGAFLVPKEVKERASTGVSTGKVADIGAGRVELIWQPLLPEILTSPVIGHGLSSVLWSEAARHQTMLPVGHPHSAYLGLLLDFGLVGVLIFGLFYRHMWRLFQFLVKEYPDPVWQAFFKGATACILLVLVQGMTDDRFTPTLPQTFLWLSYGMAIGLAAHLKAARQKEADALAEPVLTPLERHRMRNIRINIRKF